MDAEILDVLAETYSRICDLETELTHVDLSPSERRSLKQAIGELQQLLALTQV